MFMSPTIYRSGGTQLPVNAIPNIPTLDSSDSSQGQSRNDPEMNHHHGSRKQETEEQQQQSPTRMTRMIRWILQYLRSYIGKELLVCCTIALLVQGMGFVLQAIPRTSTHRFIPHHVLNITNSTTTTHVINLTLNETSNGDTIPDWSVGFVAAAICPLFQIFLCITGGRTMAPKSRGDLHRTMCVYMLALAVNDVLTWILTAYVGYLRPNFYQVCQPNDTFEYCENESEENSHSIYGGSFPSGPVSFFFCSATILYMYLERTFGVSSLVQAYVIVEEKEHCSTPAAAVDSNGGSKADEHDNNHEKDPATTTPSTLISTRPLGLGYSAPPLKYRLVSMLCGLPLLAGLFLGASRIVDHRHHPSDVVAGSLMGIYIGYFFFTMWYVHVSCTIYSMPLRFGCCHSHKIACLSDTPGSRTPDLSTLSRKTYRRNTLH